MKTKLVVGVLAFACASLLGVTHAMAAQNSESERADLAAQIVGKWGGHVADQYDVDSKTWAREMGPVFAEASMEELRAAAGSNDFDSVNSLLLGGAMSEAAPKAIGDAATDLVFVPIAPCRIFDTRLAVGAIPANTTRAFDVTAISDYSGQGGSATNCNGAGAAGSFAAAVINFTVVTPSGAGYITAFPYLGTQPLAATVNYASGDIVGNLAVVQLDQGASASELNVYSFAQTHLVGDLVGYYINPVATALQCVDTAETATAVAANGNSGIIAAPACPTGYTMTATNCRASNYSLHIVWQQGGSCGSQSALASATTMYSSRTCCRVPGR